MKENKVNTVINGIGSYTPEQVITNRYFMDHTFFDKKGQKITKTAESIIQKLEDISGIRERKYSKDEDDTAEMAAHAGRRAVLDAGLELSDMDGIIVAHNFGNILPGDHVGQAIPNLGATVKGRLGIQNPRCFAYDLLFGCPGWIESVIAGHQYIQNETAQNILVIGVELISRLLDPHDMDSMLFGDGAGAVVLSADHHTEKKGILGHLTYSHCGDELDYLRMGLSNKERGITYLSPKMDGRMVYRYAVTYLPELATETLKACGLEARDIKKFLFHQANEKMIRGIATKIFQEHSLEVDIAGKVPFMVQEIGNSSVATIPTMLDHIVTGRLSNHHIDSGDIVLMASVGAGMHCNNLIYQF